MIILIILCLMLNSMQFSEVGKYLKVKYDRNSVKVRKWTHIKLSLILINAVIIILIIVTTAITI